MSVTHTWPVAVAALSPVAVGTCLWRVSGRLNLTAVVKGTFSFNPDGPLTIVSPDPIEIAEKRGAGGPFGSLCAIRELVPKLPAVDVLVYGHAYAPVGPSGSRAATEMTVRFAITRQNQTLLDKALRIYGKRRKGQQPEVFDRIPLTYEHALGGIGFADNPLGVGMGTSTDVLPNVVHPRDPTGTVAAVGPVPAVFPARKKLLGGLSRQALEQPIAEIPADFDWNYFHSAPADQRPAALAGDEWLLLEGFSPNERLLRSRLPSLTAVARIFGAEQAGVAGTISLRADTLQIDTDRRVCSIIWRGDTPLVDESSAGSLFVAAALEAPGQPTQWPASVEQLRPSAAPPPVVPPAPDSSFKDGRTELLEPGTEAFAQATPFTGGEAPAEPTMKLSPVRAAEPPSSRRAPLSAAPPSDATFELDASELQAAAAKAKAPFALGKPSTTPASVRHLPGERPSTVPGAPWSREPVGTVPLASPSRDQTMSLNAGDVAQILEQRRQSEPPPVPELVDQKVAEKAAAEKAAAEKAAAEKAAAEKAAAEKAAAEAEARRQEEAARFAAEQEAARQLEEQRRKERAAARKQAAKTLRQSIYGGFKPKKPDV